MLKLLFKNDQMLRDIPKTDRQIPESFRPRNRASLWRIRNIPDRLSQSHGRGTG